MSKTSHQTGTRVSGLYAAVRIVLMAQMAKKGVPTVEIAEKFGVNRSYVIRLAANGFATEPTSEDEHAILAMAQENENLIRKAGLGMVFGQGVPAFKLAGGPRQAPAPAPAPAQARTKAPAPAPAPKRKVKSTPGETAAA